MNKDELRVWRKGRGFTQEEVAKLLGVRREAVVRWETGQHEIPFDILAKLEAHSPSIKAAQPAMPEYARWRPYPWGLRDYTDKEIERLRTGTYIWRLLAADPTHWAVRKVFKPGQIIHGLDITLPANCFPDPLGPEAPFARDMFAAVEARERAEFGRRNAAYRQGGIPEEKFPGDK